MSRAIAFVVVVTLITTTFGHGVQIQVSHNPTSGAIETREIVSTAARPAALTALKRVYVMPLMPVIGGAGDGWYTRPDDTRDIFGLPLHPTGPGICYQYDADQLPGSGWAFSGSPTLPNLQGTNFGYVFADALKAWNGASFDDAGVEQMQMFRGDGTAPPTIWADTTDMPPFAAMPLGAINSQSANPHHSVGYRLLGDGVSPGLADPLAGDDGVYLLSLLLTSTAAGVSPSEPFFIVAYKQTSQEAALLAAESLGFAPSLMQVVPEPASVLLLAVVGLAARRRGR